MPRALLIVIVLGVFGGCSTTARVDDAGVALAAVDVQTPPRRDRGADFTLGAGDALGRAVFAQYVAYLRSVDDDAPVYAGLYLPVGFQP